MLLPDERIRRYRVQAIKILRSKRPELEEFALQDGLQIKIHACALAADPDCKSSYSPSAAQWATRSRAALFPNQGPAARVELK